MEVTNFGSSWEEILNLITTRDFIQIVANDIIFLCLFGVIAANISYMCNLNGFTSYVNILIHLCDRFLCFLLELNFFQWAFVELLRIL